MKSQRIVAGGLAALLALSLAPLRADGVYAGASYGLALYHSDSADLLKDDSDTAWQAFLGYRFNPHFALQAAYFELGTTTLHDNSAAIEALENRAVQAAAVGILPIAGGVEIYAKLNLNGLETQAMSGANELGSDTRLAPGAGAGLSYRLGPLGLRVEYEYMTDINDMLDLHMASAGFTLGF